MAKLLGVVFALLLAALVGLSAIAWKILTQDLPSVRGLIGERQEAIMSQQRSTRIYADDGKSIIMENGRYVVHPTSLKEVSPYFVKALVATEDRRFFAHRGVDPLSILRAMLRNVRTKGVKEGGSTLTQQLARLLFLSNERTLTRKLKEIIVSMQLEQELSKEEILELYMNYVYYGQGATGIEAASRVFFDKAPKDLTLPEAAMIAGMPQAPSAYNPLVAPKLALARRNEVIQNLVEVRVITREEAKRFQATPLGIQKNLARLALKNEAPYFNQMVVQQTMDLLGLDEQEFWQSGLKIYTTLNVKANRAAQAAITEQAKAYGHKGINRQAMLISMHPKTGAIMAYEGGKNFEESQYDRIQRSPRSPGSLFKVFTYTEAVRQGYTPNRVMVDEPISFGDWHPHNYDKKFRGPLPLRKALALSNNIVAVKLMNELTPAAVVTTAKEMGIESPIEANLSATLGGASMYMVELVRAVGTLANHGVRVNPYFIQRIEGTEGETLFEQQPIETRVLDSEVADTMTEMLQYVVTNGTARAAQYGGPAAGKTGTSDDYRDAWFMGYTPNSITGVWVGYDDNTPMPKNITGGSMPAQTWRSFMLKAGYPQVKFDLKPLGFKPKPVEETEAEGEVPLPTEGEEETPVNPETDAPLVDVNTLPSEEAENLLREKVREIQEKPKPKPQPKPEEGPKPVVVVAPTPPAAPVPAKAN